MAARWPIVVGIAAITGGIAWFALRTPDRGQGSSGAGGTAERSLSGGGSAAIRAPSGPELAAEAQGTWGTATPRPALPSTTPGGSAAPSAAAVEFAAQARDPDWAPATEAEITQRFRSLRGAKLEGLECHQDQCELTVAGTEAEVGRTISELEGPKGLHGYARNVLLTAPETRDGKMVLRAYALFER